MNGFWNAKFLLQLSTIHFKFPLWTISILDEKDVHLMELHCTIHPLSVNVVHGAEHLLRSSSFFKIFISQDMKSGRNLQTFWRKQLALFQTIKMEETTTSHFMVEKEGMINFYQSTWCHKQDNSSLYTHCYENLKYHSKANNATSISSSVHKMASCSKFFRIFKIKKIANKQ